MKKQKLNTAIVNVLCLLSIFIEWFVWDVVAKLTEYYNGLVAGLFYYLITSFRLIALIVSIVLIVRHIVKNKNNARRIILTIESVIVLTATITIQFILPFTNIYSVLEYKFNIDKREKIVSILTKEENAELFQVNTNTYVLPFSLRMASQDAKVITEKDDSGLKVLFYAHRGLLQSVVVIYTSDGKIVENGEFGLKYRNVRQIDENLYIVYYYTAKQYL